MILEEEKTFLKILKKSLDGNKISKDDFLVAEDCLSKSRFRWYTLVGMLMVDGYGDATLEEFVSAVERVRLGLAIG